MIEVAGLALPFFGLIFLGFFAGRLWRRAEADLAWLNIFVLYFALPAMFFQLISRTPLEELANGRFILATTLATCAALGIAFAFALHSWGRNKFYIIEIQHPFLNAVGYKKIFNAIIIKISK